MSIIPGKRIWAVLLLAVCGQITPAAGAAASMRRWHQDGFQARRRYDGRRGTSGEEGRGIAGARRAEAGHGGGRFVPGQAAGGPRRHGGKGQDRALVLRGHRHRGLAAVARQLERAHPQLRRRRLGRRRAPHRRQDRQQGAGDRQRQHRLRVGHHRRRPALVPGRLVHVPLRRQAQHRIAARFFRARDGGAGPQDEGAGQPLLRQGAQIHLLRRPFAGRPAGHEDRAGISGTLRRLPDRPAGAEHPELRRPSSIRRS